MNTNIVISRRQLLQRATVTGLAVFGGATLYHGRQAFAQSGPSQYICQYNNVRLRDNYGLSSNVIGLINIGDVVNLTGDYVDADGYTWMSVTVVGTGQGGWTALEFFEPVLGTIIWPEGTIVHVNSDNVNLRSGPGLGYNVIGNYDSGTNATISAGPEEADGYSWHKILITGTSGWMATDFLTEGATDGGGGGWSAGTYVTTTTDLNLRTGPGTGYSILTTYPAGTGATILGGPDAANGYEWYHVETSDTNVGWFAGEFLTPGRTEPTGSRHRIFDGPLNLRSGPGLNSSIVTPLATGTIVVISDASFVQQDGYIWMPVYVESDPDLSGWIAQGFSEEI